MDNLARLRLVLARHGYASIRVRREGTTTCFVVDDDDERGLAFLRRLALELHRRGHRCSVRRLRGPARTRLRKRKTR